MWYTYFKNMLNNANLILNDLFEDIQTPTHLNGKKNSTRFF
jgi:hypothetical protein